MSPTVSAQVTSVRSAEEFAARSADHELSVRDSGDLRRLLGNEFYLKNQSFGDPVVDRDVRVDCSREKCRVEFVRARTP